jgi:hypothetical protein
MERFGNLPLSPFVGNAFYWRRRLLYTFTSAARFLSYFISMKAEELKYGAKVKVIKTLSGLSNKDRSLFVGQTGIIVGFFALGNVIKEKTRFSVSLKFPEISATLEFDSEELELEKINYAVVDVAGKGDTTTISDALGMIPASGAVLVAAQPIEYPKKTFQSWPVGIDTLGNPIYPFPTMIQPEPPQKNRPGELGERKIEA